MKTGAPRILVADDQSDVIEALRLLLKGEGYQTEAVTSPAAIYLRLEQANTSDPAHKALLLHEQYLLVQKGKKNYYLVKSV